MLAFIRKRLELKIMIALIVVIGVVVGIFTLIDIRLMRVDTVRSSEQSLRVLATAIKGSVNVAMEKGHQEDVQRIIEEVKIPAVIDRIMIYDDQGTALRCSGTDVPRAAEMAGNAIPDDILDSVQVGDQTEVHRRGGRYTLSYYSPIRNRPECFRCHGSSRRLNGILRVDFSLTGIEASIASRRNRMLVLTGVTIAALTGALALLLWHLVHRPLQELRHAMRRAAVGAEALQLSMNEEDEIGDLKRRFVEMLDTIRDLHGINVEREKEMARNQENLRFRTELQTMFNAMPDGVILVDRDLRIIQSNPKAYDLLPGLDASTGRIDFERMKKSGCPHHGMHDAFEAKKLCQHQCKLRLPGGEVRHLHSICAPIIKNGNVVFVVEVIRDITDRVTTQQELEEKTAELQKANKLLSQIAATDGLTQLANRRHFDELLFKEIKRYNRRKYSSLSMMMIDIDHFKDLNDRYGHLAGDTVLREVARLLKEGLRETDTVARYGGEEFIIVLPDTHIDGAAYKAEQLRQRIERQDFPGHQHPIHITISIGVAAYRSGTPQELLNAADQALYQAKRSGRNAVAVVDRDEKEHS